MPADAKTQADSSGRIAARGPPGESDWGFALYCRGDFDINHLGGLGPCIGRSSGSRVASRIAERYSTLMGGTLTSTTETTIWWKHWTERAERGQLEVYTLGAHLASIPTYMLGRARHQAGPVGPQHRRGYRPAARCRRQAPRSWLERTNSEIAYAHYSAKTANPAAAWGRRSKRSCNSRRRGGMVRHAQWPMGRIRAVAVPVRKRHIPHGPNGVRVALGKRRRPIPLGSFAKRSAAGLAAPSFRGYLRAFDEQVPPRSIGEGFAEGRQAPYSFVG